jgi:two-component system LytT family response regulator
MKPIRAIVVDDEESARDVLDNLLHRFCEGVEVLAKCADVPEAVERIKELSPDVVFLDIEMPQYAGYELVNFFDKVDFEMVFVTAYDQHAIRAFEVAAIDYLLKPVNIDRLRSAVERVRERRGIENQLQRLDVLKNTIQNKEVKNIVITDRGHQQIVPLETIIAIEAQESYCLLHTTERNFIVSKNLKHFETTLSDNDRFFRVHKSWIINKDHLQNYSKSDLTIRLNNNITTKLSKYKKADFEEFILI